MHLNVLVDSDYYYAFDLIKKMYYDGYDMNVSVLGKSIYNKIKSSGNDYKNLFISSPKNSFIDSNANGSFLVLNSSHVPLTKEDIHILSNMDCVFVFNSYVRDYLVKKISSKVILINHYYSSSFTSKTIGSIDTFMCYDNSNLYTILHWFLKLESKKIFIISEDVQSTRFKVEKFRCLNGISSLENIFVCSDYKKYIPEVDCCINIQEDNCFKTMILDAMHCGRPVILNSHFLYRDFCKRNNSFIVDDNLLEQMNEVHLSKVVGAKKLVDSMYCFDKFYNVILNNLEIDIKYKGLVPVNMKYSDCDRGLLL